MKKFCLLFFIVPIIAESQCPVFINDSAKIKMVAIAEKYFNTKLSSDNGLVYASADGKNQVIFNYNNAGLNNIAITGNYEAVTKMLKEEFVPSIQLCATKRTNTYIFWQHQKLIFDDTGNKKKRSIFFEID